MSAVWKLEKGLCRCCHSEGSFHNLLQPRFVLGQEEYYLEMLRQSFDIELDPVPGVIKEITFTICETCIIRLRDAANFKRQVLLCEKRFKDVYKDILKALTPSDNSTSLIKVEVPSFQDQLETPSTFQESVKVEQLDGDDDDFHMNFDDEDNEPLFDLKTEDNKKSPKAKKASTTAKKKKQQSLKSVSRQVKKKAGAEKATATGAEVGAEAGAEVGEEGGEQSKRGEVNIAKKKFHLRETDYKREGEFFVCTHCEKKISKRDTLRHHVKEKHYNFARKFICTYCNKEFDKLAPLNAHKFEEHKKNDKFKCKACDAEYNMKYQLTKHTNVYHMLGKKRKCEECEYETFSTENMRKHKVKHSTKKEFHCRFCEKSFLRQTTLIFHERIHTGDKRKVCKECGQAFVQKASLNYHMAKYHQSVYHMLGQKLKCDSCEYEAISVKNLEKHEIKHNSTKDFACRFCKKSFLRKSTLVLHEKIHTGDKRKVCKECGQAFVQKASLNYHMAKYHPEVHFN